ncbi:hypothetical protein [Motilimonas cestriensis]|uniref:hypothetical protein n=1 Tax=Motilimonas cestriensis TaxID=2742685 RepID=UPI003DA4ACB3
MAKVFISLRFYTFSRSRAGVLVTLASHPYTGCRPEEVASVQLELKPETQAIMHFCEQLNSLLSNKTSEARLTVSCHEKHVLQL